jgi:hypothetical protein
MMSESGMLTQNITRPICSYASGAVGCRHQPLRGSEYCIFHEDAKLKSAGEFWKHWANLILALLDVNVDSETVRALEYGRPSFLDDKDEELRASYAASTVKGEPWCFRGFVFPGMDEERNLAFMVFGQIADLSEARFCGDARFRNAHFSDNAYFNRALFDGSAVFENAEFCRWADFTGARFAHGASFSGALFTLSASFASATFDSNADFSHAVFARPAAFRDVRFGGPVDFLEAKLPGLTGHDDERTARYIRMAAEKHGSYADAGEFYVIEMDYRRWRFQRNGLHFPGTVMFLYRLLSSYGESPTRAGYWLLGIVGVTTIAYPSLGFRFGTGTDCEVRLALRPDLSNWLGTISAFCKSLLFSVANLVPGFFRFQSLSATSSWTTAVSAVQAFFGVSILALFLLAIRRRYSR